MLVELNEEDYRQLNRYRFAHLLATTPCLKKQIIKLSQDSCEIECYSISEVNFLMDFISLIAERVYLTLGVHSLSILLNNEECYSISLPIGIESENLIIEAITMSVASLEAPATSATATEKKLATVAILPGQTLKDISADVRLPIADVRKWVQSQSMQIIPLGSEEVIAGVDAQKTYLHFMGLIQEQMVRRGLPLETPANQESLPPADSGSNGNGAAVEQKATATKPAAKTASKTTAKPAASKPAAKAETATKKAPAKTPAKRKRATSKSEE